MLVYAHLPSKTPACLCYMLIRAFHFSGFGVMYSYTFLYIYIIHMFSFVFWIYSLANFVGKIAYLVKFRYHCLMTESRVQMFFQVNCFCDL